MTCLEMEVYRGLLNNDPVPISLNQNFSYKPLANPHHDIGGLYQIKVYTVFYSLEIKTGTNRQPVYNKPSNNQSMLWNEFTQHWGSRGSCQQLCLSGSGEAAGMNHSCENKGLVVNELISL